MAVKISIGKLHSRDKGLCWLCGQFCSIGEANRDHVVAKSRGGSDDEKNLRISHAECNQRRGNEQILSDYEEWLIILNCQGGCYDCGRNITPDECTVSMRSNGGKRLRKRLVCHQDCPTPLRRGLIPKQDNKR
ncbi:HNH endonuclease [Streptomyces phage Kenrey]|nr:HNH endonuclease [Streptomyces phage Kenrey]